jgi:hypothetical protein
MRIRLNYVTPVLAAGAAAVAIAAAPTAAADPTPAQPAALAHVVPAGHGGGGHGGGGGGHGGGDRGGWGGDHGGWGGDHGGWAATAAVGAGVGAGPDTGSGQSRNSGSQPLLRGISSSSTAALYRWWIVSVDAALVTGQHCGVLPISTRTDLR